MGAVSRISRHELESETTGVVTRLFIRTVTWYQYVAAGRPPVCRYVPSCSNYALDALEKHGAVRGSWLAAYRVIRCNPWGRRGWDPVPPPTTERGEVV
ncbi:MAG: membrane protein insertion efficiency factor YidD [Actinomycetota bacterium]|nr:membrane protein insertion efficiency factor YidD [Actinomycetota bacterium]